MITNNGSGDPNSLAGPAGFGPKRCAGASAAARTSAHAPDVLIINTTQPCAISVSSVSNPVGDKSASQA